MRRQRAIGIATSLALLASCTAEQPEPQESPGLPAEVAATHVGTAVCAQCHGEAYDAWRDSHHDLAMQEATPGTVLADFDDTSFSYAGTESTFSRRDGAFFVRTDGPDGELIDYQVAYTFGVEPLQQYLIEFPDGRLQALNIVWDTRPAADGGQRWFHLYPDENVDHRDILHWTRPLQNWNFMCAECHSTKVSKNYDAATDTFATTWAEIDVSCEACHGPGSKHAIDPVNVGLPSLKTPDDAQWVMNPDTGIAQRSSPRTSQTELETCARCHARRSILSEDYVHGEPLMNTHRPALLTEELYFADGQIMDEVYVYGSFLQSKMHAAGVTCSDCHDPHSAALKAPGNTVCARCHSPARFDTPAHHHHDGDRGTQCVDCHMPDRNYMVIDARRDHSFRVPRPNLSVVAGTPNACNGCHDDQPATWAYSNIVKWFGPVRQEPYGTRIDAGRRGALGAGQRLVDLVDDEAAPPIVRATAATLLSSNPHRATPAVLQRAARSNESLLRFGAAQAALSLGESDRVAVLVPLLDDPLRAIRIAAAGGLVGVTIASEAKPAFDAALDEYVAVQHLNADRPESHLNLGVVHASRRELESAVNEYRRAIGILPEFTAAYVNMADLYREAGQENAVETILRQGLLAAPEAAELHHSLGLSLVRQQRYDDALAALREAHDLGPANTRYAYVLGVALNSVGDTTAALEVLAAAHERRPTDRDVLFALVTMSRDAGATEQAFEYARKLLALDPGDQSARRLLHENAPQ